MRIKIIFRGGPKDGETFQDDLSDDGRPIYYQEGSVLVDPNEAATNGDGSWNPKFFKGRLWRIHEYALTEEKENVDGEQCQVYKFVKSFDRTERVAES